MTIRKIVWCALLALFVVIACGDNCSVPPTPGTSAGGFPVTTGGITVDSSNNITSTFTYPNLYVTGGWLSDEYSGGVDIAAGSLKNFALTTDSFGNGYVNGGRINANWSTSITWNPPCNGYTLEAADIPVTFQNGIPWVCSIPDILASANASTHFVLPGAVPSTITSYGDFATTYGEPQLGVYVGGSAPGFVSSVSASSVVPGVSATFTFPTQPNGSPLAEGFYSLVNTNVAYGGGLVFVDPSYVAVGGSATLSSAFGVDAADTSTSVETCIVIESRTYCSYAPTTYAAAAIFTQYYSNQVSYAGKTIAVGTQPVAAKLYGSYLTTKTSGYPPTTIYTRTTGPANAIVVNSGSSSVSIVNLQSFIDTKNISVGSQPMAVRLNAAATYAYVPSYGAGTLSEINLSTQAVSRTLAITPGLLSVAMDPSGSYVWVGGNSYLYKVNLSTFTVASSVSVSGTVTSLAASNTQNELVYTLVQNCCSASSTYQASEMLLSNLSNPGSYAHATAAPFAPYTMNGTLPSAAVLPQATSVVSARFSNGMGASSTPTGFVIYDLVTHQQIMTGTTSTPVRGIASDPDSMFAYFTLPDSNEYISVPLESTP